MRKKKETKKAMEIITCIENIVGGLVRLFLVFIYLIFRILFPFKGYTRRKALKETWLGFKEYNN